jgi:CIC family chloride channel protein
VRIGERPERHPRWWRFGRFPAHWLDVVMRNGPGNSPLDEPEAQRSLLLMSLLAVATGMIAGSTGAVLTGIIMIMEMTQDHRVMLPLILTTAVAYAIRRALMEEDIYTMKLVARGHVVPVGFCRPSVAGLRIRDLMDRDMAVKAGDELQPDRDK